jgi:SAM-dependent methyltransferase
MAQNIYDRPDFFAGYSQLERSVAGLSGAAEWPLLRPLLPAMAGLRVVDLGCGFGWFPRWARTQGAASVLGLDLSENMLARARAMTTDPAITYRRADLEQLDLPESGFDLAYSGLVLHYLPDIRPLLRTVRRALVPGGQFVFSVEHPVLTAPVRQGWTTDAEGRHAWPINGYLDEGVRTTDWLAPGRGEVPQDGGDDPQHADSEWFCDCGRRGIRRHPGTGRGPPGVGAGAGEAVVPAGFSSGILF